MKLVSPRGQKKKKWCSLCSYLQCLSYYTQLWVSLLCCYAARHDFTLRLYKCVMCLWSFHSCIDLITELNARETMVPKCPCEKPAHPYFDSLSPLGYDFIQLLKGNIHLRAFNITALQFTRQMFALQSFTLVPKSKNPIYENYWIVTRW